MVSESETIRELRRRMVGPRGYEMAAAVDAQVAQLQGTSLMDPPQGWQVVERRTPARKASRESDVIVPALQAGITGVLGALVVAMVAAVLAVRNGWPWYTVPAAWSAALVAVTTWQWVRLLGEVRARLVRVERMERRAPMEGETGKGIGDRERREPETIRVEVIEDREQGRHWTIDDLPVSRELLGRIVRRVEGGAARWSLRGVSSTPGIGGELAAQVMASLEQYGYLHYPHGRHHPGGAVPTAKGRALFRGLQ